MKSVNRSAMVRILMLCVGLSFLLITLACSSKPSESAVVKLLENHGKKTGLYKVKSVRKTNGVTSQNIYKLEFVAEVECLKAKFSESSFQLRLLDRYDAPCEQIGQVLKVTDSIMFEKTEKGWRAEDGNIY
jgi:hypothetical protein